MTDAKLTTRYARNTLANFLGNFGLVVMMLVVTPLLIRWLGDTQYGLFRVALVSVVSYAALLDMGLNNAVRRFFSDAIHQQGPTEANHVLGLTYRLYGLLAVAALLFIASALLWLPGLVNTPAELLGAFRWLLLAAGVYVAGQFLLCPPQSVLIAFGRYDLLQVSIVMIRALLFLGGIALLVTWQKSLTVMAVAAAAATGLTLLVTVLLARRVYPEFHVQWGYRNPNLRKSIFSFAGYGIMIGIGPVIVYQTQDVMIAGFLGLEWVASYAIAAILMTQMRAVSDAIASPLFPIASKFKAQGNIEGIRNLLLGGTRRCLWAWGAIAGPLIVFAGDLIAVWVAPEYRWVQVLVWILLIGNLGSALNYCPSHILTAAGNIKWLGYFQVAMAGIAIVAMVAVLAGTDWGLVGVAWAVSLPVALRSGVAVPIYACLQLRISPWRFFQYNLVPLAGYVGFGVLLSFGIDAWLQPHRLLCVFLCLGSAAVLTAIVGVFLMLPANQRRLLLGYLRIVRASRK